MTEPVQAQNPINTSVTEFLTSLKEEVKEEQETERLEAEQTLLDQSPNELKYTDISFIPGLDAERSVTSPKNILRVHVPEYLDENNTSSVCNDYEIFPGNEVLLQGELNGEEIQARGRVAGINDTTIEFEPTEKTVRASDLKQQFPPAEDVSIGVMLNPVPYERKLEAIQLATNHPISALLVGCDPVQFSHQRVVNTRHFDNELYMNDMQSEGIKKALKAEQLACLHGPPGTGKTRVIIELVRRMVLADNRVLVAAETNAAIDNILVGSSEERLIDDGTLLHWSETEDLDVARTNSSHEGVHPVARDNFGDSEPKSADVVVSTHSSAAELPKDRPFDYVIVDEATQATIPSSLISIVRADTAILVGDHKQLPPFSLFQSTRQQSLFEHLYAESGVYGPQIGIRFDTQYRMHPRIAGFPSEEFYDGVLKTDDGAGKIRRDLGMLPMGIFDVSGENERGGDSKMNPAEAKAVMMQLRMLIDNKGLDGSDIGVAAAHRKQVEEIESRLQQLDFRTVGSVKVDTFDSFQGSERDAMILSFTRSNSDGNVGFLGDDIGRRRLNVALTRAKRYCALIGDWDTLRAGSNLYEHLYEYVTDYAPPKEPLV